MTFDSQGALYVADNGAEMCGGREEATEEVGHQAMCAQLKSLPCEATRELPAPKSETHARFALPVMSAR